MRTDVEIDANWAIQRRAFLDKKEAEKSKRERERMRFYVGAVGYPFDKNKQQHKKGVKKCLT